MGRVETLEGQILDLSPEELRVFREWFAEFDNESWDKQLDADVEAGKLDRLAERAVKEHQAGDSTEI